MKKSMLILVAACLVLMPATRAGAANGPWKVSIWQSGVSTTEVQAGTEFQIKGEGFHALVLPVKVCLFDTQCQLAEPDRSGNFTVNRTVGTSGTYEVRVFEAHDPNISSWRMRAKTPLNVSN